MGRTRRSPAQKAAAARALQIAQERRHNKLGLPSASEPSSRPPLPNSIDHSNRVSAPPQKEARLKPKVNSKSVAVPSASQRTQKQTELELARERERVTTLERDLQDALRRESELRQEIKTPKEYHREAQRDFDQSVQLHEQEATGNTVAASENAFD